MKGNKDRPATWRIGSFTKNFRWGGDSNGLRRLHSAIRVGFDGKLKPVLRSTLRDRLVRHDFIDFIPANFFLFNTEVEGEDYIVVDELVFQAITQPHSVDFDRLAIFTLLLSEVGQWEGAEPEQANPSEWARYFVIDHLSKSEEWTSELYSADTIETFLEGRGEFEGNTRKLATNLSYFFNKGDLKSLREGAVQPWFANAIFLALDRYYTKLRPDKPDLTWALDTLAENDVADISSANSEYRIDAQRSLARLFLAVAGLERFDGASSAKGRTLTAVLSREPAILKLLPDIAEQWIRSRLFVEIAKDEDDVQRLLQTNYGEVVDRAVARIHNTLPKPTIAGDEVIALFRKHR